MRIETQQLPAVTDLRAEQDEFGITTLTWSEPDYSVIPAHAVTEDFESYEAFTISDFGDWKMHDGDGAYVTTIQGCIWPNYFKPTAYQIFAPAKTQPAIAIDAWQPHSGEQYPISFCCEQPQNDDWLISPELSGEEQTVSFFAKTANNEYGLEQFEFLYSTGSTDVSDFVSLTPTPVEVPVENWTQYSYKIPEGAKHFAIRCVSPYRFAFMLDDITFDVGAQPVNLVLKGYHIFRDGQQLTVEPQTARTFTDNAEGTHTYKVKVVYDLGESGFSNEVSNEGGGIPTISVDPSQEKVYTLQGMRVYTLRSGEIYLMRGRKFIAK